MRITNTRVAAAITALAAGALSAAALHQGTSTKSTSLAANQPPVVEVRTQVIRRTVHVVRHEHPPRPLRARTTAAGGTPPPGGATASAQRAGATRAVAPVRTASSGARPVSEVPRTPVASAPVRTRTSGSSAPKSAGGSSPKTPVRTRTSGGKGGGEDGGGHDD